VSELFFTAEEVADLMNSERQPEIVAALAASTLGDLPKDLVDRLLQGSLRRDVGAGMVTHLDGDPPMAELVLAGLIRTFVTAPSGRTMTVRYSGPGALLGIATIFNPTSPGTHASTMALVASRVLKLQPAVIRGLAEREVRVANALLRETSQRAAEFIDELEASSFASLRQRVARHLLDLAAEQQTGPRLLARARQEDLAAAVGTVREIVVRILRDMRDEGLVSTRRGEVRPAGT
jgi:CRP/FNR family transcriptional regulator